MATIAEALSACGLDTVDARVLMRHTCGCDDAYLVAHAHDALRENDYQAFQKLVVRRRAGEPVAYIVGTREFFSLEFKVTPAVLIPRPETEALVELALEHIPADRIARVLDLGTGSGCIAICIAKQRPRAQVVAIDSSRGALDIARENARRHGTTNVEFSEGNWFAALDMRSFDVIVSNPPYVAAGDLHLREGDLRAEPVSALVAGVDGLECIRAIASSAPRYLNSGGLLAFEHGFDQAQRVRGILEDAGFARSFSRNDLAGNARVTGGYWTRS